MNVIETSRLGKRYGGSWALPVGVSAADMLHLTRNLNRRFDQAYAQTQLGELGIPLKRKAGSLSGGQQAQLTLAYLREPGAAALPGPARTWQAEPAEVTR